MEKDVYLQIREKNYRQKTKQFLTQIKQLIDSYDLPWTVRQIHYNLVEKQLINNTWNEYHKISRYTTDGRYTGHLPWNRIIDDTRGAFKTPSYNSIEDGINSFFKYFRLNSRWNGNTQRIEVWVEKRALRRLFEPITDKYDVYLAVGGGWTSTSSIWESIVRLAQYKAEKINILYFGDLDPSGDDMPRDIEERLREFGLNIHVHKILINESDIEKYTLQKRFDVSVKKGNEITNKIENDTRARGFYEKYGELFQIEIEALPPNILATILENELRKYVDIEKMEHVTKLEQKEINRIKELI